MRKLILILILVGCVRFADAQQIRLGPTGSQVVGVLQAENGGTEQASYTIGDLLYASGTGTLSKLAVGGADAFLQGGTTPSWETIGLCGDATHALGYNTTTHAFTCQAITGSGGTVTTFSAGTLSPLFTTNVANPTTTPALTFSLSTQVRNRAFAGPTSGADAAPTFRVLTLASADFENQGTATTVLHGNAAGNPSFAAVDLVNDITGTLGIGSGGTGQGSSQAAINALSQLTTEGDLLYFNGANTTRLARGTNTYCLRSNTTTIVWANDCVSGSVYATIQEEGTPLTQRATMNFIGGAITAADDAGNTRTNITLSASPDSASVVGTGRTLTAGVGISGGGDLSADRTFTLDLAELVANQTMWDSTNASRTLTAGLSGASDPVITFSDGVVNVSTGTLQQGGTAVVLTSRTLTAGNGLTGGGDLSSDRTFDVAATSPITVAANAVECATCVTNVTGTAPIVSSGGTTPAISCPTCIVTAGLADPGGNGVVVRTALNTTINRTITGDSEIVVADGSGVSANPTLSIGAAIARDAEINVQGTANEITSSGSGVAPTLSLATQLVISGKEILGASPMRFEGATDNNTYTTLAVTDPTAARIFTLPNADSNPVQPATCSGTDKVSAISATGAITCSADTSSGNAIETSVDLGTGGGLVYTSTVTGQAWVTATSKIICQPFATDADGQTVETYYSAGLNVVTSNRVLATGFDIAVYNPNGATGIFRFHCSGS